MDEKNKLYNAKIIYNMKLSDSIKSIKFDTELYKKVRNVVILTFFVGGFLRGVLLVSPQKNLLAVIFIFL